MYACVYTRLCACTPVSVYVCTCTQYTVDCITFHMTLGISAMPGSITLKTGREEAGHCISNHIHEHQQGLNCCLRSFSLKAWLSLGEGPSSGHLDDLPDLDVPLSGFLQGLL